MNREGENTMHNMKRLEKVADGLDLDAEVSSQVKTIAEANSLGAFSNGTMGIEEQTDMICNTAHVSVNSNHLVTSNHLYLRNVHEVAIHGAQHRLVCHDAHAFSFPLHLDDNRLHSLNDIKI